MLLGRQEAPAGAGSLNAPETPSAALPLPLAAVARSIGLAAGDLEHHGPLAAKVSLDVVARGWQHRRAKYVVVTAVDGPPVGRTTQAIGVSMALCRLGERALCVTSQPWLGEALARGAAIGGGRAAVVPAEAGLFLTGDAHAVTAAHNLLAAAVDSSAAVSHASWERVTDIADAALRAVRIGIDRPATARDTRFAPSVNSEVMAILTLADSVTDLRRRLAAIIVGRDAGGEPVTAAGLRVAGAMAVLLRDAVKPTLVQSTAGTPVLVHGGPCGASVIADRVGLLGGGWVLTDAGRRDVGAERFFNIKCRVSRHRPAAALVVCRAGADDRLRQHVESVRLHGVPAVVAISQYPGDCAAAVASTRSAALAAGASAAHLGTAHSDGSNGAEALARALVEACDEGDGFRFLYPESGSLHEKLLAIARHVHRATAVRLSAPAQSGIDALEAGGFGRLPVWLQIGGGIEPQRAVLAIDDVDLAAGAGYVVARCGNGNDAAFPDAGRAPWFERLDLDARGGIVGLH